MSYTKYPAEAAAFASVAGSINEEYDSEIEKLTNAKSVLSSSGKEDLIVMRSHEAIDNVIKRTNDVKGLISSDISLVNKIANDLENEEYQRILLIQAQKEKEENGDAN